METTRLMAFAVALLIGSGLPLYMAQSHQLQERADAATHDASLRETVTVAADKPIANLPGKRLVSLIVDYPPGASSAAHHYVRSAFIYAHVFRARSEAPSMASPRTSTGPENRGSRILALIIGCAPMPVTLSRHDCSPCSSSTQQIES